MQAHPTYVEFHTQSIWPALEWEFNTTPVSNHSGTVHSEYYS